MEKPFYTTKDAAEISGHSIGSLANLRSQKRGPRYYKRGKRVLYDAKDFIAWLKENPVMTLDTHKAEHEG